MNWRASGAAAAAGGSSSAPRSTEAYKSNTKTRGHTADRAMSSAAAPRHTVRSFNQGQRVTIEGFSKNPGDALIRKINADGTLRIKCLLCRLSRS
eukprot:COSAG02_NODE_1108_length_14539_cov_4.353393_2_plen_95_part_00